MKNKNDKTGDDASVYIMIIIFFYFLLKMSILIYYIWVFALNIRKYSVKCLDSNTLTMLFFVL